MSRAVLRWAARRDLVEIVHHYNRMGSPTAGQRFRIQADATFRRLASMPGLGKRYEHDHPALAELRYFPLPSRFKKFLVFYRPSAGGIEIVRVLHGARDIETILADDLGVEEGDGEDDAEANDG